MSSSTPREERGMPGAVGDLSEALGAALTAIDAPGLAVAICDRRTLLWHTVRGVCDVSTGNPVGLSTCFALASITKTFTGMAVLMLRDAGELSLDEPLSRTVPEAATIRYTTKDSPAITLRHLLTHTSGLPRGLREVRKMLRRDPNEEELLAHISSLKLEGVPGTQGGYSNLGYALLGVVIKRVSGQEYGDFVTSRLLAPLGMASATFQPEEPLAAPHRKLEAQGFQPCSREPDDCYRPAGGLYGSMLDLIRYVGIHLNAWPPRDDPEADLPVSRATMRESHRPGGFHRVGRNSKGLGWAIERDGAIGDVVHHSGGSPVGYSSFAGFEPDVGIGIAGLANADVDLEEPLLGVLAKYAIAHGLVEDRRR
jgi:CubicO group peptidase (beta-lactamase class C family)